MSDALAAIQQRTFARATKLTAGAYPPERRLTAAQLAEYLDRRTFSVVATTRPDGRPHAVVSGYVRRDDLFWLPVAEDSVRERNVSHQPWTTLVITHGERDEHVVVIVEGAATVVPAADVPADVRAQAHGEWAGTWLRVRAERVISYASEGAL
jgi:nitroimidazol reductase NimA-like FMN-containing flavoprotein (pyridoxamine 5'-phosphate oxidase superfamily)